jgi:parallel beta-helix repeat protein
MVWGGAALRADTHVGGDITASTAWDLAGSPYVVDNNVYVYNGARLTIDPGVVVNLPDSRFIQIGRNVNHNATDKGALSANATVANPITFQRTGSLRWGGIIFEGRGAAAMTSGLRRCTLSEGGRGGRAGLIEFYGHSTATVENCTLDYSDARGIYCDATSRPTILTNTVSHCSSEPVRIAAENADALSGNTYSGNNPNAVTTYGDITRSLTWTTEGVAYVPDANITVYKGALWTLSPGVVVALNDSKCIFVGQNVNHDGTDQGAIAALGTSGNPVTLTKWGALRWGAIVLEGRGYDPLQSTLDYCVLQQAARSRSAVVEFYNHSNAFVTNSTITQSDSRGILCDATSRPWIQGNTVTACSSEPVRLAAENADALSGGNVLTGNGSNAITTYGDVTRSLTWPNEGVPYWPDTSFTVYNSATLTLTPGITVGMVDSTFLNVGRNSALNDTDRGALYAVGTEALPITITRHGSLRWGGLVFDGRGYAPLASALDYCVLSEAARPSPQRVVSVLNQSNLAIANSVIGYSDNWGVYCDPTSAPTLTGNTIRNCSGFPLSFAADNPPVISGNTYTANGYNRIYLYGDVTKDATIPNDGVAYDRANEGDIDIYNGATWTIAAGNTILFENSQGIRVGNNPGVGSDFGALVVNGTVGQPVTMSRRGAYRWLGIYFDGRAGSQPASSLTYCNTMEAGRGGSSVALYFLNHSNVTVANSVVDNSEQWGVYCDATSAPTLTSNTIAGCDSYPLAFAADNPPVLTGNTYTGNSLDRIYLYGDVAKDATLTNDGVPYDRASEGDIDIYDGAMWTIEPGNTILFENSQGIRVGNNPGVGSDFGGLIANGTAGQPITMNRRGAYRWLGIYFDGRAGSQPASSLAYCRLIDAGRGGSAVALYFLNHSNVTVGNSVVNNSENWGVYCDPTSAPTLTSNTITGCDYYPLAFAADNPPVLSGNTYTGNSPNYIYLYGDVLKDAILPYDGITYDRPGAGITIRNGATWTLLPNTTIIFDNSNGIIVGTQTEQGALIAEGTPTQRITLARRGAYNWLGILFDGRAGARSPMASSLRYCVINQAGRGMDGSVRFLAHSATSVYGCQVLRSESTGIWCDATSRPSIVFNKVEGSNGYPVRIAAENADVLERNVYIGNSPQAINVYGDITRDVTWPHERFEPYTYQTPYYPDGPFTVYSGATWTLSPGVVVGLENSWSISIGRNVAHDETDQGAIWAVGTPDLPIWFYRRASYHWGTIRIDGRGFAPMESGFKHVLFWQGGRGVTAALEVYSNPNVALELCSVTASESNGVYLDASSLDFIDSTIVANCGGYGIRGVNGSDPLITYTDSWGNTSGNFSDVTQGTGCISQNPNLDSYWRLQSPSPCIDAANPALDVGDGTTADMGAWQWGIAITSPVGSFGGGWNWFSIPLQPQNPGANASTILGFTANNILYRWNPDTKNTELYPDDFSLLEPKRGYMLRLAAPVSVTYQALGYTTPQTIPIRYQGATMIGLPSLDDILLEDLQIHNLATDVYRDPWDDKQAPTPWMNWNWVYWDSVERQPKLCALTGGDDDTARAWYGYRVWTNVDDLELLVPGPRTLGVGAPPSTPPAAQPPMRIAPVVR